MSIATITAAQRVEVRDATLTASLVMQKYSQSATTPRADEVALATPVLDAAAAALAVAGSTGIPSTSAVVANGSTVNVENSAGNLDSPGTVTVAASTVTNVRLAAAKTIVTSGQALTGVTPTGTFTTTVTFTVANGVITGIALS